MTPASPPSTPRPVPAAAILDDPGCSATCAVPEELGRARCADFKGAAATIRFDRRQPWRSEAAAPTPKGAEDALSASSVADQVSDPARRHRRGDRASAWARAGSTRRLDGVGLRAGRRAPTTCWSPRSSRPPALSLPEDVETLTDDGVVLAVGPGLDPEALVNAADPPGDPGRAQAARRRRRDRAGRARQAADRGARGRATSSAPRPTATPSSSGPTRTTATSSPATAASVTPTPSRKVIAPTPTRPPLFYVDVDAFDDAIASLAGDAEQYRQPRAARRHRRCPPARTATCPAFVLRISTDD